MPYYKFKKNDIFYNTIQAHPKVKFDVNNMHVYYNNLNEHSGAFVDNVTHVPTGSISLFELNIDRNEDAHAYDSKTDNGAKTMIFPFITKDGSFEALAGVSKSDFQSLFEFGDVLTGSYPMSASLTRERFAANHGNTNSTGSHVLALKNTLNYYTPLSNHYAFSSSLGDKKIQELALIYIPSIFYGSSIEKGSVDLKFNISGTCVGRLQDIYHNGELVQTTGTIYAQENGSGYVAGVVLYTEGVILLTGSWGLTDSTFDFGAVSRDGTWIDFAAGANDGTTDVTPSASFGLDFNGTNYVQTITMFAHADKDKLNYSTNHTYVNYDSYQSGSTITGSNKYIEDDEVYLHNTVSSSFHDYEEKFKHQTYISKIGIYDKKKNLIAITSLATPIKKNGERDFTFKIKLDI